MRSLYHSTHVEHSMKALQNNDWANAPKCILRIDIAHLIKLVCRWKCFKDKHARIKDFFVRCVGILSNVTTLENFQQICLDVLIAAFSETEDISTNDDTFTCFNAQRLLNIIKTQNLEYCESDNLTAKKLPF